MFVDSTLQPDLDSSLCAAAAAAARGAPFPEVISPRRSSRPVARARQFAVYLRHVALGATLSACARAFARDRATMRHACARIEDRRDDPRFDVCVRRLEAALMAQRETIRALVGEERAQ